MNEPKKKERFIPKGGRKGGAVFPRIALKEAADYAKKLVSKSHTSPISRDVLLSGVLGAKGGQGEVRASAVKQYSLMVGDQKSGFSAGELAKKISAAPSEELPPLFRSAALSPAIFKSIFDTYHGDSVTRAKIKQRAADLKVHPDQTEACADLYVRTMEFAGLAVVDGDKVIHVASSSLASKPAPSEQENEDEEEVGESDLDEKDESGMDVSETEIESESSNTDEKKVGRPRTATPKAVININVSLDSTTDSDKLAKQLALLRKYGAL